MCAIQKADGEAGHHAERLAFRMMINTPKETRITLAMLLLRLSHSCSQFQISNFKFHTFLHAPRIMSSL